MVNLSEGELQKYICTVHTEIELYEGCVTNLTVSTHSTIFRVGGHGYSLTFYKEYMPDFRCHGGMCIDLSCDSIVEIPGNGSRDILLDVADITSLLPHEYGLLKLKYGLDKYHLFIPEFMKPMVREFHKKVREGLL